MHTEDHLKFITFSLDSRFNSNLISEPAPNVNEPVFPSELLDSGFELTEILTG